MTVTGVTERSVSLKWSQPDFDGGCDITGYIIEEREAVRRAYNKSGTVDATEKRVGIMKN